MRKDARRTNCPTVDANLLRKKTSAVCKKPGHLQLDLPSDEGVEWEVGDEGTIQKLNDARQHEKDEEGIDNLELLWCCVNIGIV